MEADRYLNLAIADFQRAIQARNQHVLRLTDLWAARYDLWLEWAAFKRKMRSTFDHGPLMLIAREAAPEIVKLTKLLLDALWNNKLAVIKMLLWSWITGVMWGTGKLAWMVLSVGIRIYRGASFLAPYASAASEWAGTRLTELQIAGQRFMGALETYKWRGDQYYKQHEELVKKYAPRIDAKKKAFDEWWASESDYFKMALQGSWDSVQKIPGLVRLVYRFYAALDKIEQLGNEWIGLAAELLEELAKLGDVAVKDMSNDLEDFNRIVQDIWKVRDQIYHSCQAKGMLVEGTWHRPAPEVTRDSDGNIIGVL